MQFRYSGAIQILLEVQPFDFVLITLSTLLAVVAVQVIYTKWREWWKKPKDYKTTDRVGTLRSGLSSPSPAPDRGQSVHPERWSASVSRRSPSHSDGSFTSNGRSAQTSRPKAKAKQGLRVVRLDRHRPSSGILRSRCRNQRSNR